MYFSIFFFCFNPWIMDGGQRASHNMLDYYVHYWVRMLAKLCSWLSQGVIHWFRKGRAHWTVFLFLTSWLWSMIDQPIDLMPSLHQSFFLLLDKPELYKKILTSSSSSKVVFRNGVIIGVFSHRRTISYTVCCEKEDCIYVMCTACYSGVGDKYNRVSKDYSVVKFTIKIIICFI